MKHAVEFSKFIEIKYLPWNINFNRHFFLQLLHPNYIPISKLLLSGLCVSYIFHTRLYVVYPYIVIFCLCCETTFFATYHDYYYLVTTEIDLLLIYLCKSKNPSFVIPPKRPDYSGYLHKLLYLILFYNLKSKPIIYAQNINTYHLLNISMGSNSLLSWIWIFIEFALKMSFKSAVLDRFEIKNSQKSFSALIIYNSYVL